MRLCLRKKERKKRKKERKRERKERKKRGLTGSWLCRLYKKHGAGICLDSGEASGNFYPWQKVKAEQAYT